MTVVAYFCRRWNAAKEVINPSRLGKKHCVKLHDRWKHDFSTFTSTEMCCVKMLNCNIKWILHSQWIYWMPISNRIKRNVKHTFSCGHFLKTRLNEKTWKQHHDNKWWSNVDSNQHMRGDWACTINVVSCVGSQKVLGSW